MPFLPLGDANPRVRIGLPLVTWGLLAVTVLIFVHQISLPDAAAGAFVFGYGFIPAVFSGDASLLPELERLPSWATLVSYQFLHGGWDHLIGNMVFLWVFADNVEDAMGHVRFLVFYVLTGVLAALAHYAVDAGSVAPLIGASGAVSGVLGAYILLHPRARITVLIVVFPLTLPAWFLLALWFGFQVFAALGEPSGVAWLAHVGGFVAGALLIPLFKHRDVRLFARNEPPRIVMLGRPRHRRSAPSAGQDRSRRKGP